MKINRSSILFTITGLTALFIVFWPLLHIVLEAFLVGMGSMSLDFIIGEPVLSGRKGGIGPIILSTIYLTILTLLIFVPMGLFFSVCLLVSIRRKYILIPQLLLGIDMLAGLPSIVFGLFGYAFFCKYLNMGYSLIAGALTLSLMALPYFISSLMQSISSLPSQIRFGGLSLGFGDIRVLLKVEIPAAKKGLVLATLLGLSRAMAETAALLFTSGYATRWPEGVFDSGRALSVHIFDLSMNVPGGSQRAYSSAIVLLILVFIISGFFNLIFSRNSERAI